MSKLITFSEKEKFLTFAEEAVVVAFEGLLASTGVCPSNRQIALLAGVDRSLVSRTMVRMVKLGYYRRVVGRHRSYSIIKPAPRRKPAA